MWAHGFAYERSGYNGGFDFAVHLTNMMHDDHCNDDRDIDFGVYFPNFFGIWKHCAFTYDGHLDCED